MWFRGREKYSKGEGKGHRGHPPLPSCRALSRFVLFTLIAQVSNALPGFDTSSHYNLDHKVRLKSDTPIPDHGTLTLPITVSPNPIIVQSEGSPKITTIDSTEPDLQYGVGEELFIDVTLTSPVDVTGTPTLLMETGCNSAACRTKEVQTFTCLADEGKFSLTFKKQTTDCDYQQQHLTNIPVTADQEYLKQVLEQLDGINKVTVYYGDTDDREYSYGRRVCTSKVSVLIPPLLPTNLALTSSLPPFLPFPPLLPGQPRQNYLRRH